MSANVMPRDRDWERRWLDERARVAGNPAFASAAIDRLDDRTTPVCELRQLCIEIQNSAADIGGRAALAMQLRPPPNATTWTIGRARHLLTLATELAAMMHLLAADAASQLPAA